MRMCGRSVARSSAFASPSTSFDSSGASRSHSAARLDPRHALEERLAPLGQAAVDLRVGPAGELLDLLVAVALGAQHERADLLRLQLLQRLRPDAQPVDPLGLVVRERGLGRRLGHLAVVGDGRGALALPAERPGLVLHDGAQPRHELLLGRGGRLRQQDLDAALVGVLGVLGRGGVPPGGRHDRRAVALQQRERRRLDLRPRRPPPRPEAAPVCPLPHGPLLVQTPPPRPPCARAGPICAICAVSAPADGRYPP